MVMSSGSALAHLICGVYDKSGDRPVPIGMLWVRISDIAEEMRRKKIETDLYSRHRGAHVHHAPRCPGVLRG
jgi:hypothetical protein